MKFTLSPKVRGAQTPVFHEGSAGIDLITPVDIVFPIHAPFPCQFVVDTGVIIDLEQDDRHYFILPRSSWSKLNLRIANTVGLIDYGYRGPQDTLKVVVERSSPILTRIVSPDFEVRYDARSETLDQVAFRAGDRFCQIVIMQHVQDSFNYVPFDDWSINTSRGGFGSTGK